MQRTRVVLAVQLAIRAGVAALLSVGVAHYFGLKLIQPLITSCLVIDLSPEETRRLAFKRLVATVLGGVIGASLDMLLPSNPIAVGLGVLAAMLASELLRLEGTARLAGFVCGICVLQQGDPPWSYASARLIETAIGIAMAVLASHVPRLIRVEAKA